MTYGRLLHEWDHTATLWAMIGNTANDPEKRPEGFNAYDIHPYRSPPDQLAKDDGSVGFWQRVGLLRSLPEGEQAAALGSLMASIGAPDDGS